MKVSEEGAKVSEQMLHDNETKQLRYKEQVSLELNTLIELQKKNLQVLKQSNTEFDVKEANSENFSNNDDSGDAQKIAYDI